MGGMGGGAAGKKYSLNASVNARNAFNVVNLAAPNGTLTSTFFGVHQPRRRHGAVRRRRQRSR